MSGCCGGSTGSGVVEEMEKQDEESQEKDMGNEEETTYKLTAFNDAEALRFIFYVAGTPFEDNRVERDNWEEIKSEFKWGKLPVLQFDNVSLYSFTAIGRFLAKRFDLTGKDDIENALCDQYVEICQEVKAEWKKFMEEEDEAKKMEEKELLMLTILPDVLAKFNEIVEENSKSHGAWLIGDSSTWADLVLGNTLEILEQTVDPDILASYPGLKNFKTAVFSITEIAEYCETRSETLY